MRGGQNILYIIDVTFKEGRRATAHFREAYMAENAAQAMMDAIKSVSAEYSADITKVQIEMEV